MSTIHEVRLKHENELMALPGVVGVADTMTGGREAIQIFVEDIPSGQRRAIPSEIEGYPVEVISAGEITPLN